MKAVLGTFGILFVAFLVVFAIKGIRGKTDERENKSNSVVLSKKEIMNITSSQFKNNSKIPSKYTCEGEDVNPSLTFTGVPEETKSLVLIVDDPDAPAKTWVHWVVFNIPPDVMEIEEDSVPDEALLGRTDFGNKSYGGPCPPSGSHRYFFRLYALDTLLDLESGTSRREVDDAMQNHILDEAELIGVFSRN